MNNYALTNDETILYHGEVLFLTAGKKAGEYKSATAEIVLTNFNLIIKKNVKGVFVTNVETEIFKVESIKIYNDSPQITRNKKRVDICLTGRELFLVFYKEKEAREFCDKALRLVSGNSKFVRAVKKTQKAVKETNEALDIDLVEIAKGTTAVVATAVVAASGVPTAGKKTKMLGAVVKSFMGKKDKPQLIAPEESEDMEITEK